MFSDVLATLISIFMCILVLVVLVGVGIKKYQLYKNINYYIESKIYDENEEE